ncbi:MAG TPA: HYR domain-containing protein, partial [Saprospiraceae bacterium]|nr:HYR domain-containing protein [Saprospiraceae bacterium]
CTQTIVLQDFTGPTPDQGPGGFDAQVDLIYADFHNGTNHTHDCPNDLYLYHSPAEYLTYNGTDLRFEHFHGDEFQTVPKATATDVCGTVSQSINYGATTVDASMLPCTLKINLVWDFNDGCGNITQYTQVITIVDKAPLAINPNAPNLNQTVSCTANLDPVDLGGDIPNPSQSVDVDVFMDFDNCTNSIPIQPQGPPTAGGPTGLYWQDAITAGPCPETYTITRSWWAIDECGNVSLPFFQTIQVQDIVPPTWNQAMPANITVQCNAVPPAATPITASDNCDVSVNVTLSETSTKSADVNSCAYMNYTLTRTWTAMDNCGNMLQHTQTITVIDTQIPTLNGVPANTTVQCNAVPPPAVVTASDNCDPVVPVTLTETSTKSTDINSCAYMNYTITRTWTASDNCGNATARTQIITVVDTQIPTLIGVPANATVECDAVPAPANVSATDNCDPVVPVTLTETSTKSADVNGCAYMNYTITRTWKASDNCGNMSAGTQVITVQDTKPPVLAGVPANTTVQCHQVPPAAVVTATDNCDPDVPVTFSEQVTPGPCVDSYTLTRTWTASDNCGNATTSTQVINVIDTVNPTALCKDHTLYLNGDGEAQLYTYQIDNGSFDNCTLDHLDLSQYLFTCDDLGQNTVILTATDACGNTGTCTATVTVIDALPPHMVCLSSIDLYLDEFGTPLVLTPQDVDGGTTDNCTIVSLELSQTIFDCSDLGENSIKLFATDQSGNQGECSSNVRVYDLLPPVFTVVPEDVTAYCDEYGVPDEAEATDNCGIVSIVLTETQEYFAGGPEGSYLVQRTWVATDLAGNTSSAEQWITVLPDGQMVTLCNDDIVTAPSKAPVQATWDAPKVDDICNGSYAMTQMEGPASGSYFNPGTRTRITYGYQDSWGTRYECAFHVEVPGINDDYQVHIQQADADCGDHLIESCTISDVSGASLNWTPKGSGIPVEYSLQPGATLEKYANGTALLIGQWRDASGTNGWDGTLWFHHRRSYDGWTQ